MKANKQHSALEVIKKEQLKRRVFSVEFKAEVVGGFKSEVQPRYDASVASSRRLRGVF